MDNITPSTIDDLMHGPPSLLISAVIWVIMQSLKQIPNFKSEWCPSLSLVIGAVALPALAGFSGANIIHGILIGALPTAVHQMFSQYAKGAAVQAFQAGRTSKVVETKAGGIEVAYSLTPVPPFDPNYKPQVTEELAKSLDAKLPLTALLCALFVQGCQTPKPSPVPVQAVSVSIASLEQQEKALTIGTELQMRDAIRTASAPVTVMSQGDEVASNLEHLFGSAVTETDAVRSACGSLSNLFSNEIALYDFACRGRDVAEKLGLLNAMSAGIRAGLR